MATTAPTRTTITTLSVSRRVNYRALDTHGDKTLPDGLRAAVEQYQPQQVIGVEPGDLRVRTQLDDAINLIAAYARYTGSTGLKPFIDWREDKHFLCSLPQFRNWAGKSASLRMEFFYRTMRKQYRVLMEGDQPVGGQWNFDAENPKGFGKAGPKDVPKPLQFKPDRITADVIALVEEKFADHPGELSHFNWPVTREHRRHGAFRQRRPVHVQALRGQRCLRQAHEQLLHRLRLRARNPGGRQSLPDDDAVLEFSGPA